MATELNESMKEGGSVAVCSRAERSGGGGAGGSRYKENHVKA